MGPRGVHGEMPVDKRLREKLQESFPVANWESQVPGSNVDMKHGESEFGKL